MQISHTAAIFPRSPPGATLRAHSGRADLILALLGRVIVRSPISF